MGSLNSDGTPVRILNSDRDGEEALAQRLGAAWDCEVRLFPRLSPVDGYAVRDNRIVAVLEFKSRGDLRWNQYDDVWLSWRKWQGLMMAGWGMACEALYVVEFGDRVGWVPVWEVPRGAVMGGRGVPRRGAAADREPMLKVPGGMFKWVNGETNLTG